MFGDDDLAVFYPPGEGTVQATRSRPGEDDAVFTATLSEGDEDRFDGQAMAGVAVLQYPTAAAGLQPGDALATVAADSAGVALPARLWRVLRSPERVVDGAESRAYLKPEPEL